MTVRTRLLVVSLTAGLAACRGAAPAGDPGAASAPAPQTSVVSLGASAQAHGGISLATVESVSSSGQVSVPGVVSVDETRTSRVGSLQEGLILSTLKQVGDQVGEGQLLATMHGHAMHDAWAGYRKAVAARQRADAELAYAVDALARAERLLAARAVAAQDVRRAELDRVAAVERLTDARAEVTRSIEELEHVGVHIKDTGTGSADAPAPDADEPIPVRSPLAGVVLERLVTPGTTVVPGAPLYTISDLASVWVVADVDESLLPSLRVGRGVEVRVAAWPGEIFAGRITFIGDVVNPDTRRVSVRAALANGQRRLKPAMYATVTLSLHDPQPALVVPKGAVQTVEGRATVFVAGSTGQFTARPVTLGAEVDGRVEVLSGLQAGERVAATGGFALKSVLAGPAAGE